MKQRHVVVGLSLCLLLALAFGASIALAQPLSVVTAGPSSGPAAPADDFTLTLLHTNDTHGRVDGQSDIGGSARLATVINEYRATRNDVLLVDAGDQFQGTLYYRLYKADVITSTMNMLGYDAMTIGNHEFDDGPPELARLIDGANFPVVSANIDASADPLLSGRIAPTTVVTVNGEPIGIVGITTPETAFLSSPGPDVQFSDPVPAVQAAVDQFTAQGINKVIALTHYGYNEDIALAQAVHGLDIVVGGHSHTFIYTPVTATVNGDIPAGPYPTVTAGTDGNTALVVTAFQWSRYLGHLDVTFNAAGVATSWDGNPIYMGTDVPKDPAVAALIDIYRPGVDELRNTFIGTTTVELPIIAGGVQICRTGECLMGNMVADAMLYEINTIDPDEHYDIAFTNGGGLRAPIDAGPVSVGEVLEVLPFGNTMATFGLHGSDLVLAVENGVSRVGGTAGTGRFPQISGMRFSYNPRMPVGSRVVSVDVWNGTVYEPVDPDRVYKIVSNNFTRTGGDEYTVFRDNAIDPYDFGPALEDGVMDYITTFSPITPQFDGRITAQVITDTINVVPSTAMAGEMVAVSVTANNAGGVDNILHIVPLDRSKVQYVDGSVTGGAFPVNAPLQQALATVRDGGVAALKAYTGDSSNTVAIVWMGSQAPGQAAEFGFQVVVQPGAAGSGAQLKVSSYLMSVLVASASTTLNVPALNRYEMALQNGANGYSGAADTFMSAWTPAGNYGLASNLYVRQPGIKSDLVKFDLSGISSLAQVSQARIGLYATYGSGNPVSLEAYRLLKPWVETEATWMQASAGSAWEVPGAMGASDRAAQLADRVVSNGGGRWLWFDVTGLAQEWVVDPGSNNGVVIMGGGFTNAEVEFTSSDYVVTSVRPQLRIVYQAP